ncbi:MAG: hypothetical protein WKF70_14455, partial [Chitinophagaceae bacterium]
LNRLPLTPAGVQTSNDSIRQSLISLGSMYLNELEDYQSATETYENLRQRFPKEDLSAEALFALQYSYARTGNTAKAQQTKQLLVQKYPTDRRTAIITTGKDPASTKPSEAATRSYEKVYDLFLGGNFAAAKNAKRVADSVYKTNYWSPQLLYIEAVYHIKQREDSAARTLLNTLIRQNVGTPLAARAENMIEVLGRRKQIEEELKRTQVVRPTEDSLYVEPMPVVASVQKQSTVIKKPVDTVVKKLLVAAPLRDTAFKKPAPVKAGSLFTFKPDVPYFAVVVLDRVDPVFGNEARNAFSRFNKEKFYNLPLDIKLVIVNDDIRLLVISTFTNVQGAIDYVQNTKPVAASQIVPWLKGDKFTFSIISQENLDVVINTKDFAAYTRFLNQAVPVKF